MQESTGRATLKSFRVPDGCPAEKFRESTAVRQMPASKSCSAGRKREFCQQSSESPGIDYDQGAAHALDRGRPESDETA